MKDKRILIGTTIGVTVGTAIGVATGISIGMVALGMLGVDMNSQLTSWVITGMSVGVGISLVRYVLKNNKIDN